MEEYLKNKLNEVFKQFKTNARCINAKQTNNYYVLDVELINNGKIKDISNILNEISLYLKLSKPNINTIHENGIVRLEFMRSDKQIIDLLDYMPNVVVPSFDIPCLLGEKTNGERLWIDIAKCPHMLIAGTTGSGKSSILHTIIANVFKYSQAHTILIDPKNIEFKDYGYMKTKSATSYSSYEDACYAIQTTIDVMNFRYAKMRGGLDVNNFPPIVVIIDEFSDLILQDEDKGLYNKLCNLAQKCRAAKIHIILATQRPSANIINGAIKANFPARISCRVASAVDSRVILDYGGAENLAGNGDAILKNNNFDYCRFQAGYATSKDIIEYFD